MTGVEWFEGFAWLHEGLRELGFGGKMFPGEIRHQMVLKPFL